MAAKSITILLALLFAFARCQTYDKEEIQVDESKHDTEFFTFVTRPDIDAPKWDIEVYNKSAVAPGFWFVAPYGIVDQVDNDKAYVAPHIYDSDGELIWSGAATFDRYDTFTFKVSNVLGKDMLTALHPKDGRGVIMDDDYEISYEVPVGVQGVSTNMHDFQVVDNGTKALFLTLEKTDTLRNARQVGYRGGPCKINYNGIHERDIKTGDTTFLWSTKDQIALEESTMYKDEPAEICENKAHNPADYLHLNAVEKLPSGDYLVSGRRSDAIYKISHADGSIIWRLGGKKSDFEIDGHFSGQHDVRCLAENSTHLTLTIMDNAYGPGWPQHTNPYSRGLVLSVNTETMTAKAVKAYNHPHHDYAVERGNFQTLPNGNALLFWTENALTSEHTPDGEVIKVAKLKSGLKTYRGYKFEWVGRPKSPPNIHSEVLGLHGELTTAVHVSWNGATEVAFWNLYKTNRQGADKELVFGTHRTGFETAILYPGFVQYVVVEGVDREGNALGESEVFETLQMDDNIADPALVKELEWLQDHPSGVPYDRPLDWEEEAKSMASNPLFTFLGGILFCVAAGLSGWGVWAAWRQCTRTRKQRLYAALAENEDEREVDAFYDKDITEMEDRDAGRDSHG